MIERKTIGEKSIWQLHKAAFLCSDKFSAGSVLRSYDWAGEKKRAGRCVMSGFHSKIERDVFDILLRGNSPLIWVLAGGDPDKIQAEILEHTKSGRLLIILPLEERRKNNSRSVRERFAHARNQFIVDNADEVVFAHIRRGGKLERLALREGVPVRVLDRADSVTRTQTPQTRFAATP
jgi:hypothetical protein